METTQNQQVLHTVRSDLRRSGGVLYLTAEAREKIGEDYLATLKRTGKITGVMTKAVVAIARAAVPEAEIPGVAAPAPTPVVAPAAAPAVAVGYELGRGFHISLMASIAANSNNFTTYGPVRVPYPFVITQVEQSLSVSAGAINGWNVIVSDSPTVGVGVGAEGEVVFRGNNAVKGVEICGQGAVNIDAPHDTFYVVNDPGKYLKGVTINFGAAHYHVVNLFCRELVGAFPGDVKSIQARPVVAPVPAVAAAPAAPGPYRGLPYTLWSGVTGGLGAIIAAQEKIGAVLVQSGIGWEAGRRVEFATFMPKGYTGG